MYKSVGQLDTKKFPDAAKNLQEILVYKLIFFTELVMEQSNLVKG